MKIFKYIAIALLSPLALVSCENMDANYIDYLEPSIYSGKISKLSAVPGNSRVFLQWNNPVDQISKTIEIVYGEDEKVVEFDNLLNSAYITDLDKSTYEFTVYTKDIDGHRSIPVSITSTVFTQSAIDKIERPTVRAAKQANGTYNIEVTNLTTSQAMFGGLFNYTLKCDGQEVASGNYTVVVSPTTLKSKILSTVVKGVTLDPTKSYTVEYENSVYPAIFKTKTSAGEMQFTSVSSDVAVLTGSAKLVL